MDWMKFRKIYFIFSGAVIALGIFSLVKWGMRLGVDFSGGTIIEYKFEEDISTEEASKKIEDEGVEVTSIQKTDDKKYLFRVSALKPEEKDKVKKSLESITNGKAFEELRYETVGPSISPELIIKTFYAIAIASTAILLWVAYQCKSIKFGTSAILAMFHDSFILVGFFSLFGHFWQAEVDFLFITALLTTLSFSVHDTIVVYDRIREFQKKNKDVSLYNISNIAITETMVRSLNNSFTILFMLVALILLGGTSIKWFSVALLIGTIFGTYSSPFIAVPILVTWEEVVNKLRRRK